MEKSYLIMKSKGQKVTILILLFILGMKIGYSQCDYSRYGNAPRELTVGRISEPGMRSGHPYTLFVKTDNFNLEEAISKIRLELFNGLPKIDKIEFPSNSYADLYKGIWQNANLPEPGKCPEDDGCDHPKWVKNNAIIHLIGLRYEKTESDKDTLILMGNVERDEYAGKAYDGLKNLNPNVEGCPLGECGFLRRKAFDLIQYAESYDILKATFLANDDDKNDGASLHLIMQK
jgi:hypothetical protein